MKLWRLVLFLGLMNVVSVLAAPIGNITDQVDAPPSITRQKNTITGGKGTGVEMDDSIKTAKGKTGITFLDNTKVQINENSKLVIDDFVYDPKKGSGKLALNMALGTVRYASGAIAHNSPAGVSVNTPSATVSVRGTDFTATVDELGQSTIVLLPSCPDDRKKTRTVKDIEANCVTGEIVVESDAGQVILNQPFQATRVLNRSSPPTKPVVLSLGEDQMNNMLIISPPKEIRKAEENNKVQTNVLDVDFLKYNGLANQLDIQQADFYKDKLSKNFLDQSFLMNIFDMMGGANAALNEDLLKIDTSMLPDYRRSSGITVTSDDMTVQLCRDNGADVQCIGTPKLQNSTIYQTQGNFEFKNRVNSGQGTTITLIQK
jgi:hypothetical protein